MTHTQQAAAGPHVAGVCELVFTAGWELGERLKGATRGGWEWKGGWDGYFVEETERRGEKRVAAHKTHTHTPAADKMTDWSSCLEEEATLTKTNTDWQISPHKGLKDQSDDIVKSFVGH